MAAPIGYQDKSIGIADQTKSPASWGTGVLDSAAFVRIDAEKTSVDFDMKDWESDAAKGVRFKTERDNDVSTDLALSKIAINTPAKKLELDMFLYGFFQNVTEGDTTPYLKTFSFPVAPPHQPDLAANGGFFATIIERRPTSGHSSKIIDAIVQSLSLNLDTLGKLQVNSTWIGRGIASHTATPSGTWTQSANDFFKYGRLTTTKINYGSGDTTITLKNMTLNLSQDVEGVGYDTGKNQTLYIGNRQLDFDIKIMADANSAALRTAVKNGTLLTFKIGWGNSSSPGNDNGDLFIEYTGRVKNLPDDNDPVLGIQLTGKGYGAVTPTSPINIKLATGVDRQW